MIQSTVSQTIAGTGTPGKLFPCSPATWQMALADYNYKALLSTIQNPIALNKH